MRDLVAFTQRTRSRGSTKAVLVYPADRMNAVAANALLKTLEEPPGDVKFVLATDAANRLLPTITSRCQTHAMRWPDAAAARDWLVEQGVADPATAALCLRASGGRPGDALRLARAGLDATALDRVARTGRTRRCGRAARLHAGAGGRRAAKALPRSAGRRHAVRRRVISMRPTCRRREASRR